MLTSILSNTATENTKNEEWRLIADEQSHAFKHIFGALQRNYEKIGMYANDPADVMKLAKKGMNHIDTLNRVTLFMLNTLRAEHNAENESSLRDRRYNNLIRKKVSLKDTLIAVFETLENSVDLLGLSEDDHGDNIIRKCLPKLAEDINKMEPLHLNVIPVGLEIILTELLKNALFNTDSETPEVSVFYETDDAYVRLHITNNSTISVKDLEFITNQKPVTGMAKQYKAGIRTIWRILNFIHFNSSDEKWKLESSSNHNSKLTDIFIRIPKLDLL